MAVTLAQALLSSQSAIQKGVIDEFIKSSFLFENIIFDDVVAPGGGGALVYGYTRQITQGSAAFRAINVEFNDAVVTKQQYTVNLVPFGGKFGIDRIIKNMGSLTSEIQFQLQQKIKATQALFNNNFINGDDSVTVEGFDGIDVAITGSTTELNAAGDTIDLSTSIQVDANYKEFLDKMDEFLALLDGTPSFLGMNSKMKAKMISVARRAGYYTREKNSFGVPVDAYNNIPLIDMGTKENSTDDVVATATASGETSIFAVRLGLDGVHAASLAGVAPIQTWMPDFSTQGALKYGEVEMVAAVALKATKAAGVLRKIKVA
jgi:hypothetical protein